MVKCPSCGRLEESRLICEQCGSPLAANLDLFSALGLPRKLAIDTGSLERIYHELGRRMHPDRFASSQTAVRTASLHATSLLTRAYRTLRDPVTRGLYWLELSGEKLAENNKQVPAELAELVFNVQEQLAELRDAQAESATAVRALRDQAAERRNQIVAVANGAHEELNRNFARWDSDRAADRKALTRDLKAALSTIAYLTTLLRDIDRELQNAKAA
jgi:molecular chaperone HscB